MEESWKIPESKIFFPQMSKVDHVRSFYDFMEDGLKSTEPSAWYFKKNGATSNVVDRLARCCYIGNVKILIPFFIYVHNLSTKEEKTSAHSRFFEKNEN